jgi:hypothetical protein
VALINKQHPGASGLCQILLLAEQTETELGTTLAILSTVTGRLQDINKYQLFH